MKELWFHRRFAVLFILCFSVGLSGLSVLMTFQRTLQEELRLRSKAMAGADLNISGRQKLNQEDHQKIHNFLKQKVGEFQEAQVSELFTMVANKNESRLIQLKVVSENYPFYGEVKRQNSTNTLHHKSGVWVYPEVLSQLGLEVGDSLRIGEGQFVIEDVVIDDPSAPVGRGSIAPRVFLSQKNLEKTKLVQQGSTIFYAYLFKLPESADAKALAKEINHLIADPALNANDHENASEFSARMFNYLGDYLGLVALVSLGLSTIGSIFLFQSYVSRRLREMAVLRILGTTAQKTFWIYSRQIVILSIFSGLFSWVVSWFLTPLLHKLLEGLLPFQLKAYNWWEGLVFILAVGVCSGWLVALPTLQRVRVLKPQSLFQENAQPTLISNPWDFMWWSPAIVGLYLFSAFQAKSWQVSLLFVGLLVIACVLLGSLALLGLKLCTQILKIKNLKPSVRHGFLLLIRQRAFSVLSLIAVGFGVLLVFLVSSVEKTLQNEFSFDQPQKLPSLFFFDIQPEQLKPLTDTLISMGLPLENASPLVRARLESVNGVAFKKSTDNDANTREEEASDRFRNRGLNLSERDTLSTAEVITEGKAFSSPFDSTSDKLAEVSVEFRYAERLGLKLGDELIFDIQGVPVSGKIVNLRRVRWAAFQPNFFVQFQAGVLTEAPRTYLASLPSMSTDQKLQVQTALVKKFPNVSMVDVTRTVDKILSLSQQMTLALKFMALLVFVTGIVVMASILEFRTRTQIREMNLFRVLGFDRYDLRQLLVGPLLVWILFSSFLAVSIGSLITHAVTHYLYDQWAILAWQNALFISGISLLLGYISSVWMSLRLEKTKPQELFG